jgi:hypothetical protein
MCLVASWSGSDEHRPVPRQSTRLNTNNSSHQRWTWSWPGATTTADCHLIHITGVPAASTRHNTTGSLSVDACSKPICRCTRPPVARRFPACMQSASAVVDLQKQTAPWRGLNHLSDPRCGSQSMQALTSRAKSGSNNTTSDRQGFGLSNPSRWIPRSLAGWQVPAPQQSGPLLLGNRRNARKPACAYVDKLDSNLAPPVIKAHHSPIGSPSDRPFVQHQDSGGRFAGSSRSRCQKKAKQWLVTGPRLGLPGHRPTVRLPWLCSLDAPLLMRPNQNLRTPSPSRVLGAAWLEGSNGSKGMWGEGSGV